MSLPNKDQLKEQLEDIYDKYDEYLKFEYHKNKNSGI